jgi:hypothetical protein
VNSIVDASYIGKDAETRFTTKIRFGTYKWNAKQKVNEDHIISPQDVQAHMV